MSEAQAATAEVADAGPQFRAVRHVTLPVFSFKGTRGQPRYYRIDAPMYLGKKFDDQKEAAHLLRVTDLLTGQLGLIVVPTVMRKELLASYPNDSYVGKSFELRVWRMAGARYNHVGIVEVEMSAGATPQAGNGSPIPEGARLADDEEGDPDEEEGGDDGEEAEEEGAGEPEQVVTASRTRSRAAKSTKTAKRRR